MGKSLKMALARDLLPLVERRDALAVEIAKQTHHLKEIIELLAQTGAESLRVSRQNTELAAQTRQLVEGKKARLVTEAAENPMFEDDISSIERELKANKRAWRIAKETASAIVASSGVDWVRDKHLRSIVLDQGGND